MNYYHYFFIGLLIAVSIAFYYIISPFSIAIIFALIIVHFFRKPFIVFKKKFNEKIASMLAVIMVIIIIIVPMFFLIFLLSIETKKGYSQVQELVATGFDQIENNLKENSLVKAIENNPLALDFINSTFFDSNEEISFNSVLEKVSELIREGLSVFFSVIRGMFLNLANIILSFLVMLYLLYFFFREGDNLGAQLKNFIPMEENESNEIINESFKIIDATLIGTFIIGIFEGIIGGLIFYSQSIPSPITWGLMMAVASMIPLVGTNGFLLPLAIYKFIIGEYFSGAIILFIGCGAILISQNIVKPKLVGDRSGLHPALILLSSLGGIYSMGIIGFLIGPIIATIFVVFWRIFKRKNNINEIVKEH